MTQTDEARARDIRKAITAQNWKLGGVLMMDNDEAEALIVQALSEARREGAEQAAKVCDARRAAHLKSGRYYKDQPVNDGSYSQCLIEALEAGYCAEAIRALPGDQT